MIGEADGHEDDAEAEVADNAVARAEVAHVVRERFEHRGGQQHEEKDYGDFAEDACTELAFKRLAAGSGMWGLGDGWGGRGQRLADGALGGEGGDERLQALDALEQRGGVERLRIFRNGLVVGHGRYFIADGGFLADFPDGRFGEWNTLPLDEGFR